MLFDKPLIIVIPSRSEAGLNRLDDYYTSSLVASGAIPLIVPYELSEQDFSKLVSIGDGFLYSGGVDLSPALYGETTINDTVNVDTVRDAFELMAFRYILDSNKPIFAICRGIQTVNVAMGGSLYQDIPCQLPGTFCHSQKVPGDVLTHNVRIVKGSRLRDILGCDEIAVNSYHHQAVKTPAAGLKMSAYSPDGICEALEGASDRFILLLQWHPEKSFKVDENSRLLFKAFVKACAE